MNCISLRLLLFFDKNYIFNTYSRVVSGLNPKWLAKK